MKKSNITLNFEDTDNPTVNINNHGVFHFSNEDDPIIVVRALLTSMKQANIINLTIKQR